MGDGGAHTWLQPSASFDAQLIIIMYVVTALTLPLQVSHDGLQSKQAQEAKLSEVAKKGGDLKGQLPSLQPVEGPIRAGRVHTDATELEDHDSPMQVSIPAILSWQVTLGLNLVCVKQLQYVL